MMIDVSIRLSRNEDRGTLRALYTAVFPCEDLVQLVDALLDLPDETLSLVADTDGTVVGHIVFTLAPIIEVGGVATSQAALLGPLAVHLNHQRQGIGGRLIDAGLKRLAGRGVGRVFVLGDPNYYGRFGFTADTACQPPYPLPEDWVPAWQSRAVGGNDEAKPVAGKLKLPPVWMEPRLWAP